MNCTHLIYKKKSFSIGPWKINIYSHLDNCCRGWAFDLYGPKGSSFYLSRIPRDKQLGKFFDYGINDGRYLLWYEGCTGVMHSDLRIIEQGFNANGTSDDDELD